MKLDHVVYDTINSEPTFLHRANQVTRPVAEDFKTFTNPGVLHVCMSRTERDYQQKARKRIQQRPALKSNGDMSDFYSKGGVAISRDLMNAFFETDLKNVVFWVKQRADDRRSVSFYQMREEFDEYLGRVFYMNVVQYDYHPWSDACTPTPYRVFISDRMMSNASRLLRLGSGLGMSRNEGVNILDFAQWSNTEESRSLLATALSLLENHLFENKTVNFARLREGCDEARIYSDNGRHLRSLPYTVKPVKSLQDLAQPIEQPASEVAGMLAFAKQPKDHCRGYQVGERTMVLHQVRGHWRHYVSGKVVFVREHTRGNADKLVLHKMAA